MRKFTRIFMLLVLAVLVSSVSAQKDSKNDTTQVSMKPHLNIWAMVHLDVIYDIKQMDPDWIGGFRPSKIPVYPTDPGWGTYGHTYFSVRQSTFKFEGVMPLKKKWGPLRVRFEFDLFGLGVHAGETSIRFRLAYGEWGPFRIGKDWSTFIDLEAFPNTYDWWGPSGMALLPSTQIRFTQKLNQKNMLEFSLELPGSDIDPGQLRQIDPSLLDFHTKEMLPDFISRYTFRGDGGYFKGAVLLRQLSYEIVSVENENAKTKNIFGWAVNLTSAIHAFKHHGVFRLQGVFGHGYAGYNNDGGVEITPDANLHAVVPFQYGYTAFYNHYFNKGWMASAGFSQTFQDNTAGQTGDAFNKSQYMVAQVIYEIIKDHFYVGLDYQYGKRFNKDKASANDQRVMFSVRYQMSHVH